MRTGEFGSGRKTVLEGRGESSREISEGELMVVTAIVVEIKGITGRIVGKVSGGKVVCPATSNPSKEIAAAAK